MLRVFQVVFLNIRTFILPKCCGLLFWKSEEPCYLVTFDWRVLSGVSGYLQDEADDVVWDYRVCVCVRESVRKCQNSISLCVINSLYWLKAQTNNNKWQEVVSFVGAEAVGMMKLALLSTWTVNFELLHFSCYRHSFSISLVSEDERKTLCLHLFVYMPSVGCVQWLV